MYDVHLPWLTNKLREIMNSLISVFHPLANICLYLIEYKTIWFVSIWI
jgi:hypothetical protein